MSQWRHNCTQQQPNFMPFDRLSWASDAPLPCATFKSLGKFFTQVDFAQYLQQLAVLQRGRVLKNVENVQGLGFQRCAKYLKNIAPTWSERPTRLSPCLLNMLAVLAYHQPATRADIEHIDGVSNSAQVLRALFDWNWIDASGFRELPKTPAVLVTTPQFLNAFALHPVDQLPPLQNAKEAFMTLDASALRS